MFSAEETAKASQKILHLDDICLICVLLWCIDMWSNQDSFFKYRSQINVVSFQVVFKTPLLLIWIIISIWNLPVCGTICL